MANIVSSISKQLKYGYDTEARGNVVVVASVCALSPGHASPFKDLLKGSGLIAIGNESRL